MKRYQRRKEEQLRHLQEKMQLLEMEGDLHQCGGESERTTVDGRKVDNSPKDWELYNDSVAVSEAASGFMTQLVSKAEVRAKFPIDLQVVVLNKTNNDNSFDFSTGTVNTEETQRSSQFLTDSVVSPGRRLPGESTAT